MKYSEVVHMMSKQAYGGDLVGDGTSYYDLANFYSIDPEWDEPDVLSDKRRYKDTVKSMQEYAKDIRDAANIYNIDGAPVTSIVLSKQKYNEGDNIDGLAWADKVDAAIAAKDPNAIYDLASYGYAWYGTDKGKNLSPMRALRMDSQGRIIQSGESKGAWIGLGVMGGVGLLAALACYGKEKGWFNGMQKKQSLQKAADYSDFLTHDFYDKLTPSGGGDLERYTAYYKGLDKLFGKILKGKHGLAYMGRGANETGETTGLYVSPLFGDKAISYSAWKGQVEEALKAKALDDLESLTYPTEFHVTTSSPESTYGDVFENSPSDDYVKSIYGASPKLSRILALAAKHRQLSQDKQNVLDALYDAEEPFDAEYDKLEEEKQKALQDIDARTDAAWNKWFDAEEAKKDKAIVSQLRKEYEALEAEYNKQEQPFIDRGEAIANRQYKIVNPYHKQLDTLENRVSKLYGERL